MATAITLLPPDKVSISTEEHVLLDEALAFWHDPSKFQDTQVAQVKDVFKKVFGLPEETVLAGSTLPDAVLLQRSDDIQTFYVIVQAENPGEGWEAMELRSEAQISLVKTTPFRLVLFFLANSMHGMTWETK